ncbi:hypothetical protein F5Y07DRAFT_359498 [Xylaria sp. FL0933]|nr:hypothetical protein F5Y07DRAFT_359498 [Xylaria sp. FL0933]
MAPMLHDYPELDRVFISGGIERIYNLFKPLTTARTEQIVHEITTYPTAPNILAQLSAPWLL